MRGGAGVGTRVSFFFTKNPNLKVSELFLQRIQI